MRWDTLPVWKCFKPRERGPERVFPFCGSGSSLCRACRGADGGGIANWHEIVSAAATSWARIACASLGVDRGSPCPWPSGMPCSCADCRHEARGLYSPGSRKSSSQVARRTVDGAVQKSVVRCDPGKVSTGALSSVLGVNPFCCIVPFWCGAGPTPRTQLWLEGYEYISRLPHPSPRGRTTV